MTLRGMTKTLAVGACAALLSVGAQAATVTLAGATITYEYDDTQVNIGMWGEIDIIDGTDIVTFEPTNFEAQSINGSGPGVADATFYFDRVYSNSGNELTSIMVSERADYEITNGGSIQVDLYLQAVSNTGFYADSYSTDSLDAAGDTGGLQVGTVSTSLDAGSYNDLFGNPTDTPTDVSVTIQNTLTAITGEGNNEVAWVEKKLTFVAVAAVPVPAAAWLFGSALMGLLAVGRRRAAVA